MDVVIERSHLNGLVCLLQDLQNLYVYWDFSPERIRTFNNYITNIIPGATISLRLCRFGSETPDRMVNLGGFEAGNYYFRDITPDKSYHFEIGAIVPDHHFILFAKTPVLEIQPNGSEFGPWPQTLLFEFESGERQISLDNFSWS